MKAQHPLRLLSRGRIDKWLSRPGVQPWIARVGGEVAGMVELELLPGSEVGIVVFGLVPELVAKGFGVTC